MEEKDKLPRLTLKRKRFIKEYLKDLNATQAVLRAGYDTTPETASQIGYQLLHDTSVLPHLNKALADQEYRIQMDTEDILDSVMNVAIHSDITDFITIKDGMMILVKPFEELTDDQRKCIKSIKPTSFGVEVHLHDKMKALEFLGKWKKIFQDTIVEEKKVFVTSYDMSKRGNSE